MLKLPVEIFNDKFRKFSVVVELYTYSEEPEFVWNAEAFNSLFQMKCKSKKQRN